MGIRQRITASPNGLCYSFIAHKPQAQWLQPKTSGSASQPPSAFCLHCSPTLRLVLRTPVLFCVSPVLLSVNHKKSFRPKNIFTIDP